MERAPLPNADGRAISSKKSWRDYLTEDISREWTDLILLIGCFATGLLDAAVFNVWQCFVSMQTGESKYWRHASNYFGDGYKLFFWARIDIRLSQS